jgi:polysaccharide biosynthesis transport protein
MSHSEAQQPEAGNLNQGQEARPQPLLPVPIQAHTARAEFVPPNSGRSAAPDAMGLMKALRRRWLLAVTLGVIVGALAAGGTWLFLPNAKHSAHTWLLVSPTSTNLLGHGNDSQAEFNEFKSSQVALVKSRLVLTAALRDKQFSTLHVEGVDPVEVLSNLLVVDFKLGPTIMQISIAGDNEEELKTIVNAVADAYVKEIVEKDQKKSAAELTSLDDLRDQAQKNMKLAAESLKVRMEFAGGTDPVLMRMLVSGQLLAAQQQLQQTQARLRESKSALLSEQTKEMDPSVFPFIGASALGYMRSPMGQGPILTASGLANMNNTNDGLDLAEDAVEHAILQDKALSALLEKKQKLQGDLEKTKLVFSNPDEQPEVKRLKTALKDLDSQIEDRRNELRPKLEERFVRFQGNSAKRNIASIKRQIRLEEQMLKTVQAAVDDLANQVQKLAPGGNKEVEFVQARVIAANAEEVFKQADHAVTVLKLNTKAQPRITASSEKGVVIHGNDLKRRSLSTAGAGAGGFLLILFGIGFIEFRTRKIHSVDEVSSTLGIHIVGTLPAPTRPSRVRGKRANDAYWQNMLTESVDAIRTMLLHTARKDDLRIVMVTSAVGGEGKTSLASHLAASLARAGCNTLILDCDLRKPAAHRMFDVEREPGFSEILRGEADLVAATHATPADNLSVIPAGRCDALALQILAQGGAESAFEELRAKYDFVIVDSAPVLPVADSLLIGQHVDAVVFSILRDISRVPRVHAAYNRLAMLGIRMLGAVVNGTREDSYGPDYHYASMST